ncbi:hypothetical protein GLYMA_16G069600v4 [Glycine max]|uniref:Uncharacterized protein n=1 Tax=Glycine max TaxID=3847 RepID=A0A0R0FV26_SOYBN|nr:hypothetical protein GLYMA_16G069600v4 [Glycine max]
MCVCIYIYIYIYINFCKTFECKRIVHSFITLGETLFECRSAFCTHPSKEEPAKHTKARYIKVKDIARRKASGHFKHEHQDLVSQSSQPAIVKPLS